MVKVESGFLIQEAYTRERLRRQEVIITSWVASVNLSDCFHFRTSFKPSSLSLGQHGKQNCQEGVSREAVGLPFMQVPVCKSK